MKSTFVGAAVQRVQRRWRQRVLESLSIEEWATLDLRAKLTRRCGLPPNEARGFRPKRAGDERYRPPSAKEMRCPGSSKVFVPELGCFKGHSAPPPDRHGCRRGRAGDPDHSWDNVVAAYEEAR